MSYSIFLTIELGKEFKYLDSKMEYDLLWEKGKQIYFDFTKSEFNVDIKSEYVCLHNYFKYLLENKIFILNADVLEINRYTYNVDARTKDEAIEKLKKNLETTIPYPDDIVRDGVICFDVERAMETKEIVTVF